MMRFRSSNLRRELATRSWYSRSFARIFYRNALNLGLPALILADAPQLQDGDLLRVDAAAGIVENLSQRCLYRVAPLPPPMLRMIAAGGLIPHLKQRFAEGYPRCD